jgi:hypothetical protein
VARSCCFARRTSRVRSRRDVADLPEQIDALLDVSDEVATGELVVVEHGGE